MTIEIDTNNPLGLTVAGPGYGNPSAILYPGQTGNQTSAYNYTFAQFPNAQTGIAAGIDYIRGKITSGAATTAGSLVNLFSPNDWSAFARTTGLSPNSLLDPSQAGTYAAGIAAGEGTLNAFGGAGAFTGGGSDSVVGSVLGGVQAQLGNVFGGGVGNPMGTAAGAAATAGKASAETATDWVAKLEAYIAGGAQNVVFVIVGVVLIIGALYAFAVGQGVAPPPGDVAKAALAAA